MSFYHADCIANGCAKAREAIDRSGMHETLPDHPEIARLRDEVAALRVRIEKGMEAWSAGADLRLHATRDAAERYSAEWEYPRPSVRRVLVIDAEGA